jgi:hypothetical protein
MPFVGGPHRDTALDRHLLHEVGQLVRALEANGPRTEEELALLVGAPYWERYRFQRALGVVLDDGLVRRDGSGLLWPES